MRLRPKAARMSAIRNLIVRLGEHPRWCSLALGGIAACGFQPLALWPLTLFALAVLIELVARAPTLRQAFILGWLFGLSHFSVGNNWIATAFTYQANMPQWLGGIAVVLLSLYLAIYPALCAIGAWFFRERAWPYALAFAAFWIVTEWLRGWVFTGFAWNPLGVALLGGYDAQGLAFTAPWIGTYGLSGLLVGFAAALRILAHQAIARQGGARVPPLASALLLLAVLWATMALPARYLAPQEGGINYTLVQPDIRQEALNDSRLYETHFHKTARLTVPRKPGAQRIVFWPESGLPDYLRDGYPPFLYRLMTYGADPAIARERLGQVIGTRSLLLTGAVDVVVRDGDDIAARNSITAIDDRGNIIAGYSKAHLVPYGEYLPLRWLLEPLGASRLVAGSLDFWPGPGPQTFDFGPWGRAGMQICYEIVFSGQVVDPDHRPDYIFNPSNDGWFGSWGPPQHLAQARLRAIEEGMPVLRATTTGISAVIDADGIVRGYIPRHEPGRLDGRIPPAHAPTLFAQWGNALPITVAAVLLFISTVAFRRRKG